MKNGFWFGLIVSGLLANPSAWSFDGVAAPAQMHAKLSWVSAGQVVRVRLRDLQATQSGVGYLEVEYRKKKIRKMSEEEYADYEKKKTGRVIMRNGRYYLIDGNHMANAAFRAGKTSMLATLVEDLSAGSEEEFRHRLVAKKYCYLEREGAAGMAELRDTLRKKVIELADRPYRSLAWGAREVGAFEKTEEDYAEFRWARYFEERFEADGLTGALISSDPKRAVRESLRFAHLPSASALPGYKADPDYTAESVEKKLRKLFD